MVIGEVHDDDPCAGLMSLGQVGEHRKEEINIQDVLQKSEMHTKSIYTLQSAWQTQLAI